MVTFPGTLQAVFKLQRRHPHITSGFQVSGSDLTLKRNSKDIEPLSWLFQVQPLPMLEFSTLHNDETMTAENVHHLQPMANFLIKRFER